MNVTNMVISSWTAHTEYLLPEHQWHITRHTKVILSDQTQGTTMKIKTGKANSDHSPTTEDIAAQVVTICIETTLDQHIRINAVTTEAPSSGLTQPTEDTATDLTVTHCTGHIADHPHIAALGVIDPKIAVSHTHYHPTDPQGMNHTDRIHTPAGWEEGHIPSRTWRWR